MECNKESLIREIIRSTKGPIRCKSEDEIENLGYKIEKPAYLSGYYTKFYRAKKEIDYTLKTTDLTKLKPYSRKVALEEAVKIIEYLTTISPIRYIVNVYSMFLVSETLYQFMDHYPGGSIHRRMGQNKRFKPRSIRIWLSQLGEVCRYMDKHGIAHRSLRVEHLLLDKKENLFITGWTRAMFVKNPVTMKPSTCHRENKTRKKNHMPPECFKGSRYNPETVDLWSFGVIIASMFTIRHPFVPKLMKQTPYPKQWKSFETKYGKFIDAKICNCLGQLFVEDQTKRIDLYQLLEQSYFDKKIKKAEKDKSHTESKQKSKPKTKEKPIVRPSLESLKTSAKTRSQETDIKSKSKEKIPQEVTKSKSTKKSQEKLEKSAKSKSKSKSEDSKLDDNSKPEQQQPTKETESEKMEISKVLKIPDLVPLDDLLMSSKYASIIASGANYSVSPSKVGKVPYNEAQDEIGKNNPGSVTIEFEKSKGASQQSKSSLSEKEKSNQTKTTVDIINTPEETEVKQESRKEQESKKSIRISKSKSTTRTKSQNKSLTKLENVAAPITQKLNSLISKIKSSQTSISSLIDTNNSKWAKFNEAQKNQNKGSISTYADNDAVNQNKPNTTTNDEIEAKDSIKTSVTGAEKSNSKLPIDRSTERVSDILDEIIAKSLIKNKGDVPSFDLVKRYSSIVNDQIKMSKDLVKDYTKIKDILSKASVADYAQLIQYDVMNKQDKTKQENEDTKKESDNNKRKSLQQNFSKTEIRRIKSNANDELSKSQKSDESESVKIENSLIQKTAPTKSGLGNRSNSRSSDESANEPVEIQAILVKSDMSDKVPVKNEEKAGPKDKRLNESSPPKKPKSKSPPSKSSPPESPPAKSPPPKASPTKSLPPKTPPTKSPPPKSPPPKSPPPKNSPTKSPPPKSPPPKSPPSKSSPPKKLTSKSSLSKSPPSKRSPPKTPPTKSSPPKKLTSKSSLSKSPPSKRSPPKSPPPKSPPPKTPPTKSPPPKSPPPKSPPSKSSPPKKLTSKSSLSKSPPSKRSPPKSPPPKRLSSKSSPPKSPPAKSPPPKSNLSKTSLPKSPQAKTPPSKSPPPKSNLSKTSLSKSPPAKTTPPKSLTSKSLSKKTPPKSPPPKSLSPESSPPKISPKRATSKSSLSKSGNDDDDDEEDDDKKDNNDKIKKNKKKKKNKSKISNKLKSFSKFLRANFKIKKSNAGSQIWRNKDKDEDDNDDDKKLRPSKPAIKDKDDADLDDPTNDNDPKTSKIQYYSAVQDKLLKSMVDNLKAFSKSNHTEKTKFYSLISKDLAAVDVVTSRPKLEKSDTDKFFSLIESTPSSRNKITKINRNPSRFSSSENHKDSSRIMINCKKDSVLIDIIVSGSSGPETRKDSKIQVNQIVSNVQGKDIGTNKTDTNETPCPPARIRSISTKGDKDKDSKIEFVVPVRSNTVAKSSTPTTSSKKGSSIRIKSVTLRNQSSRSDCSEKSSKMDNEEGYQSLKTNIYDDVDMLRSIKTNATGIKSDGSFSEESKSYSKSQQKSPVNNNNESKGQPNKKLDDDLEEKQINK